MGAGVQHHTSICMDDKGELCCHNPKFERWVREYNTSIRVDDKGEPLLSLVKVRTVGARVQHKHPRG